MQEGTPRRHNLFLLSLFVALGTLSAQAQYIRVTRDGLDPATVHTQTGEHLYWLDADGGGPYDIYGIGADGQLGFWTTTWPGPEVFQVYFTQPGTYSYYDENSHLGTIIVEWAPNVPPALTINSPTNNAVFLAPASFSFDAVAYDLDYDGLWSVLFYVGTNRVDYLSPVYMSTAVLTTSVTNLAAGNYTLTVIANDTRGGSATNSISITVTPRTPLVAKSFGNQLVISWDTNNVSGLTLESTTNLTSSPTWTAVTTPPVVVGGQMVVTNPIVGTKRFFRLSNH